jgi:hypothetical protein
MMPRPRPPHLHRETNRHGKTVWYVRVGKGPRIRIKGIYGTPEFEAAYRAAISGDAPAAAGKPAHGSLDWLWMLYRQTDDWRDLSMATRRQRENIMRSVLKTGGSQPLSKITGKAIKAGIDRRKRSCGEALPLRSRALVGVDCSVGEQKLSAFASPHHRLDGVEQKDRRWLGVAQLTGRVQIVPGDLERAFEDLWRRFGHVMQTRFAEIVFRAAIAIQEMLRICASPSPIRITSPTPLPNRARANGATWEIVPCRGSASSSPTIRKVCRRSSSRTIVTVWPKRMRELSDGSGITIALLRRAVQ